MNNLKLQGCGTALITPFKNEEVELVTLTDYDTLIGVAKEREYIRPEAMESLAKWRLNPEQWSKDHGE